MKMHIPVLALLAAVILASCEDAPPTEYIPEYVLEGYLIVGRPIDGITVMLTQPTTEPYRHPASGIADAEVDVIVDGRRLRLAYRPDAAVGSYYYPDTTELVKAETTYAIEVRMKDGALLTGRTTTPKQIEWRTPPKDVLVYPGSDALPPHDSLDVAWTDVEKIGYLLAVKALDTLGYGRYLSPPTDEPNERIFRSDGGRGLSSPETARWFLLQRVTTVPMNWRAFKWFGEHEITVYAPDPNFLDWYTLLRAGRSDDYDYRLASVEGGLGVFGSASVATRRVFLRKR